MSPSSEALEIISGTPGSKGDASPSLFLTTTHSQAAMDNPWTLTSKQILQRLDVDPERGLTPSQAAKHAKLYGKNGTRFPKKICGLLDSIHIHIAELPEEPPTPLWELVLEQFKDQLVLILLGSAVVSFILALLEDHGDAGLAGAFVEPLVILLILVANAAVGVIQESNAEKAIDVRRKFVYLRMVLPAELLRFPSGTERIFT